METKELVYLFLYNPMIYTSGWTTLSIHKSRKRAIEAMEEHKKIILEKWTNDFKTDKEKKEHPFGKFEDWRVVPMILES